MIIENVVECRQNHEAVTLICHAFGILILFILLGYNPIMPSALFTIFFIQFSEKG
jgi:hypothetical protein